MSYWQRVKEAWPVITVVATLTIAGVTGWFDTQRAVAQNATASSDNAEEIEDLLTQLETRATKFLTDREFKRIWDKIQSNFSDMEDLRDRVIALGINDERVRAKIEIEVEKLRGEIKDAAREQQQALQEQTNIMQQILSEVRNSNLNSN